jgi:hypothetical protein
LFWPKATTQSATASTPSIGSAYRDTDSFIRRQHAGAPPALDPGTALIHEDSRTSRRHFLQRLQYGG